MPSLFSIPELEALPPQARPKLIRGWLRDTRWSLFGHGLLMFGFPLLVFVFMAIVSIPYLAGQGEVYLTLGIIVLVCVGAVGLVWVRLFFLGELRNYVVDKEPTLRFNICPACGYDLRATPADCCPECGK